MSRLEEKKHKNGLIIEYNQNMPNRNRFSEIFHRCPTSGPPLCVAPVSGYLTLHFCRTSATTGFLLLLAASLYMYAIKDLYKSVGLIFLWTEQD